MRPTRHHLALFTPIFCALSVPVALAADGTWTGGPGNWNTTATNWTGVSDPAWDSINGPNNKAIFGGSAETVTLTSGVFANALQFETTGYTISGANTLTLAGATPTITTNAAATISSTIAGIAGLTKEGVGTLTLSGTRSYSGNTVVNAGIIRFEGGTLTHATTFSGSGTVQIGTGVSSMSNSAVFGSGFTGTLDVQVANFGALGNTASFANNLGDLNVGAGASIGINGVANQTTAILQFDAITGSGAINNGAVNTVAPSTLKFGSNNGSATFSGNMTSSSANNGRITLQKFGTGIQTFTGTISNGNGGLAILGGTVMLDFSGTKTSNILPSTAAIVLGGGTLDIQGGSGEANTQTLNGVSGAGTLKLTSNSATSINLTLGAIARTLNFVGSDATSGGLGFYNFLTTTTTTGEDGSTRLGASLWNGTTWASTSLQGGANRVVAWQGSYSDLTTNGAASNFTGATGDLRILGGTGVGTATTYSDPDTAINSLLMAESANSSTVDLADGSRLTVGMGAGPTTAAVAITDTGKSLTIGSVVGQGILTAGDSGATPLHLASYNPASTLTINSLIENNAGSGAVSLVTGGNVTLNAVNTYTGTTTIGGTLEIGDAGSLGASTYAGAIANAGVLKHSSSATQAFSGAITGPGRLIKDGSSTLTLSNTGTNYTGATTVSAGTLLLRNPSGFASSTTVTGGNLTLAANGASIGMSAATTVSLAGGSLTLNNETNHYLVMGGAVTANNPAGSTITYLSAGATTQSDAFFDGGLKGTNQTVTIDVTGAVAGTGVVFRTANTTLTGSIIVNGNGTGTATEPGIAICANSTTPVLSGADITLNSARLETQVIAGDISWAGGTSASPTIGALNGNANAIAHGATATTLTVGATGNNGTFAGVISGAQAFTKTGTGTQTLSGANTYTGITTVNGGTLLINGTKTGTGTVSVAATLGGTGTIAGATTVQSGGTLAPGNSVGNLTFGSTVELQAGSFYAAEISGIGTNDKITAGGALTVNGTIKVTLLGGYSPASGAVFDLADASISGSPTFDFTAATLSAGLSWDTTSFANNGTISVTGVASAGYGTWSSANAGGQASNLDFDNDGVQNGTEFFFGATGSTFTANPTLISGTVTWPKSASFTGSYKVETSTDLVIWTDVTSSAVDNGTSVTYTPTAGQPKRFVRLVVNPT